VWAFAVLCWSTRGVGRRWEGVGEEDELVEGIGGVGIHGVKGEDCDEEDERREPCVLECEGFVFLEPWFWFSSFWRGSFAGS